MRTTPAALPCCPSASRRSPSARFALAALPPRGGNERALTLGRGAILRAVHVGAGARGRRAGPRRPGTYPCARPIGLVGPLSPLARPCSVLCSTRSALRPVSLGFLHLPVSRPFLHPRLLSHLVHRRKAPLPPIPPHTFRLGAPHASRACGARAGSTISTQLLMYGNISSGTHWWYP